MDFLLSHPELHESFRRGDDDTLGMVYEDLEPQLIELFSGGFTVESTGMRAPPLTNPDDVAGLVNETMLLVLAADVRARVADRMLSREELQSGGHGARVVATLQVELVIVE